MISRISRARSKNLQLSWFIMSAGRLVFAEQEMLNTQRSDEEEVFTAEIRCARKGRVQTVDAIPASLR